MAEITQKTYVAPFSLWFHKKNWVKETQNHRDI